MNIEDFPTKGFTDEEEALYNWREVFENNFQFVEPMMGAGQTEASVPRRISAEDVKEVYDTYVEFNEVGTELTLLSILKLNDGRWAFVNAWNDYTGWGCQDQVSIRIHADYWQLQLHGIAPEEKRMLGWQECDDDKHCARWNSPLPQLPRHSHDQSISTW